MRAKLIMALALALPVSAQPPPNAIEASRQEYLAAKEREGKLKARLPEAAQKERQASARLLEVLEENEKAYAKVTDELDKVREKIIEKYVERARAAVIPAGLLDEHSEYRRRLAILTQVADRVDPAFFRRVEDHVRQLQLRLASARAQSDQKIAAIELELAALRAHKATVEKRLAEATPLTTSNDRSVDWSVAVSGLYEAQQAALEAERSVGETFEKYAQALTTSSPPYLQSVSITVRDEPIYLANWGSKNQNQVDIESLSLRALLPKLEQDIEEIDHELKDNAFVRLQQAHTQKLLVWKLDEAAASQQQWAESKILVTALVEASGVAIEVLTTGGVATAVRQGTQAVEDRIAKEALARLSRARGRGLAKKYPNLARMLGRIPEAEMAQVQERVTRDWLKLNPSGTTAKGLLSQGDFRALKALTRNLTEQEAAKLRDEALAEMAGPIKSKLFAEASMKLAGENLIERLKLPEVREEQLTTAASDTLEFAFERGLKHASLQGKETLRALASNGRGATYWQQTKTGVKTLLGPRVNWRNFKQAFKPDLSMGITLATSAAKIMVVEIFGGKEDQARDRFAKAMVELSCQYQASQVSLAMDKIKWEKQRELRNERAQALGWLAEVGKPRTLQVEVNSGLPSPKTTLKIELKFSTYLLGAPAVNFAGMPVKVSPVGRGETADRWVGSVPMPTVSSAKAAELTVNCGSGNRPFKQLDSQPSTPASLKELKGEHWLNYEPGPDQHHKLLALSLQGKWLGTGYEKGPEVVLIRQTGAEVIATKVSGSTYIPKNQVTWKGQFTSNVFQAKVQVAKSGNRDPLWRAGTVTVVDKDHLKLEDEKGWQATFVRQTK